MLVPGAKVAVIELEGIEVYAPCLSVSHSGAPGAPDEVCRWCGLEGR